MNILIIEDDLKIRRELDTLLVSNGYQVLAITDFENILDELRNYKYDLILLDINLPGVDGFEIASIVRKESNVPIIFVTSRSSDEDELKSIITGGNDFITKPYNKLILLEKIKRALNKRDNKEILEVNEVILDPYKSAISYKGEEIELTRNEFRIIYYFFINKDKVLSKEELIEHLWNDKYYLDESILLVNINRLRKKLEVIGVKDFIKTVRGKGYSL